MVSCNCPLCDPKQGVHRYVILIFVCMVTWGSYYSDNNIPPLQSRFAKDMNITKGQYHILSSIYRWQNCIIPIIGGLFIDKLRLLGIRISMVAYCTTISVGQLILAVGGQKGNFWVMLVGRFIFGFGGETLSAVRLTYSVMWFKPTELNVVNGLLVSVSLVGRILNLYFNDNYTNSLFIGLGLCIFSLFCAIIFAFFDYRAIKLTHESSTDNARRERITQEAVCGLSPWLIYIICATFYMTLFPYLDIIPVFLTSKYGISFSDADYVKSVMYLISIVAIPILGFVVDKVGYNLLWLNFGIVISIVPHVIVAYIPSHPAIPYVVVSLLGLGYSMFACVIWPLLAFVVPHYQLGTAFGIMLAMQNFCITIINISLNHSMKDNHGYFITEGILFHALLWVCLTTAIILYIVDKNSTSENFLNMSGKARALLNESKGQQSTNVRNSTRQRVQPFPETEAISCHNAMREEDSNYQ